MGEEDVLADSLPALRRPQATPPFTVLAFFLLHGLLRLLFRVDVRGRGLVPPGPFVLVANHLSQFDPLLLITAFPLKPRVWFLAAAERTLGVGWRRTLLLRTGGIIPIYARNPRSGRRALHDAERVLAAGGVVGIFPEGRIGPEEGRLQPVHPGAAQLSLRTGVPMLPVWMAGTRRVWWRKRIQVIIGAPFYPPAGVPREAATASLSGALELVRAQAEPEPEPAQPPGLWINNLL